MNLLRSRSWGTVKPAPGAQLDPGHPLAQSLLICYPFNEMGGLAIDAVRGFPSTTSGAGTYAWKPSPRGSGLHLIAPSILDVGTEGSGLRLPTTSCTIALGRNNIATGNGGHVGTRSGVAGTSIIDLYLPYTDNIVYWDFGGSGGANRLSVGSLANLVGDNDWAFTGGLRGSTIWQNGALRASQTTAISRTTSTAQLELGRNSQLTGGTETFRYFYIWNRELTGDEIEHLAAEPYAMFQPPGPKILYFAFDVPAVTPPVTSSTPVRTLVLGRQSGMGHRQHSIRTPVGVSS